MGVHGLWQLLESAGKPVNPETLEGKILAVDISIWLNQAVKGLRDREGNSVQNSHLLSLFHRICKLLFFRIRPVFVFDGDAPLLKKQTLALRRQRKEELTRESKQTNEKLLRTFLKRQAIKAVLGGQSKETLPSLSSVRRDEVDDMYVLPALPEPEVEKSSSEEEGESREEIDDSQGYQDDWYEDPNSVDINSEEFANLPPEMRHEMLKEMKEFSKRRRTMIHKPPERSGDFSQYQLAGLLQRNRLNQRLEGVEKEMSQRSAGGAPQLSQQDGDLLSHDVESNRLVSEDNSHYILIKGTKNNQKPTESQPAAAPWSGSSLSGCKKAADRPEPLWRPVCEEGAEKAEAAASSSSGARAPSQNEDPPLSPRTLGAIQAALNESSDEDVTSRTDGRVSPRTHLAIQRALTAEEERPSNSTNTPNELLHRAVPPVAVSSSDEDTRGSLSEMSDLNSNQAGQSPHIEDSPYSSSSEEELEEVISQRNKAIRFAAFGSPQHVEAEAEEENSRQTEKFEEPDQKQPAAVESSGTSSTVFRRPETENNIVVREEGEERVMEPPQETDADEKKSRISEESDSEESFIEVPEDELKKESKDSTTSARRSEEPKLESPTVNLEEQKEEVKESPKKAVEPKEEEEPSNDWEHIDMGELEALENSLQTEQSILQEQKQQQERMANTVTGQMYLESQELLRLFGVPFLVAPMEAEAQCAALDRADQTNGTITDDSDVWLFGGRHVYKNFFSQSKYVEHYQFSEVQNHLGLDRTKLINLAYLLGSDYTEGVPGVGYVTGMEILNEFPGPGLEPLIQFSRWWSEAQEKKRLTADPSETKVKKKLRELTLQPGFPNPAVAQAYLQPAVDSSDSSFSWGRPQLDMIKEFCLSRFGWSSKKTEETLQPVMKQLNSQQTQLRIDSFFRMEQQEKQGIRSQRLRRAVTCLKRKEREGEGDEDSEEEMPSPAKSKKAAVKNSEKEKEERKNTSAGGFLGSELDPEPSVCSLPFQAPPVTNVPQSSKAPRSKTRRSSSSSSSGEDSDVGGDASMVTAKSVFEGNKRGRGGKKTSERGRGRGRGRGKKQ